MVNEIIKKYLLKLASWLIRTPFYKLFIIAAVKSVYYYRKYDSNHDNKKSILILNHERFTHDLDALSLDQRVKFLILPSRIQTLLNSLFLSNSYSYKVDSYINEKEETKELVRFVVKFVNKLNDKYNLCGIISCSFYYRQDFSYEFSSLTTHVPFYVIFKEYMKDDVVVDVTINRYKQNKFHFIGKQIFSANKNVEKILLRSGVCREDQISIVGSPRFDVMFNNKDASIKHDKQVVTLFSFYHSSGLIELEGDNNFFSDQGDGYYDLFKDVHTSVAELAVENRGIEFVIKTKWGGQWHDRIVSTIYEASGIDILCEPNISLMSEGNAQTLIKKSSLVVAFNSTTILEAGLLGRNVIVPVYAEAIDKYFNSNLYFTKYLDSLIVASSNKDLKDKIMEHVVNPQFFPLPDKMMQEFLGFCDGQSSKRILDEILENNKLINK